MYMTVPVNSLTATLLSFSKNCKRLRAELFVIDVLSNGLV